MSDPRFSALTSDPRYRLPSRKEARTAVDPRFKTLFTDQEFRKKASVDRYGRKIKPESTKKDLERLYRLDRADKSKARKQAPREAVASSDESEHEDQESQDEELAQKRDLAREGFSESESSEEETSDEEEESDAEVDLADGTAGQEQTEDIPMGEVSKRIACVNLDWDNIRAADIMAVAQSFAPKHESIRSVTIYPSEFGRERLEREEIEGPPREIFASSSKKEETEEDDESSGEDDEKIKRRLLQDQASEGEEFDTAKLRQYQLERLRYYYAVISCDMASTGKALYDAMDGREYLSTSNFFDLRFIPDETSFDDDKPHDECSRLPSGYKPNDFRTEALTHSKVRLTWDDDDATRKEVQKRAFSRAEMDENDLQAYIGSDESDADSTTSRKSTAEDRKAKKKEAQRAKMREALGLSSDAKPSAKKDKDEVVGDMQITFTSGLGGDSGSKGDKTSIFENEPQDEESTRARYIRKEKERKQKRKERMKASSKDQLDDAVSPEPTTADAEAGEDDDPFNDPFFTDPTLASTHEKAARAAARKEKARARAAADAEAESRRAELELLMADDEVNGMRHFDERELERARKAAKRKGKGKNKGLKKTETTAVEDDFDVDTGDPRFEGLFDSHEFAIDPTHARFKDTEATKKLREEQRRKRKHHVVEDGEDEGDRAKGSKKRNETENGEHNGEDVRALAARLKKKVKRS